MRIGFVAHSVHRQGGMERAAAEVLSRLAQRHEIVVAARECDLSGKGIQWVPISCPRRPALLKSAVFRRKTARIDELKRCDVIGTIGAAGVEADVVTAQFCHAAFTARFGGLRGGKGIGGVWQRFVQSRFTLHEREIYRSSRLRRVIAVSQGISRELSEYYGVDPAIIRVIPNAVDHAVFKPAESDAQKLELRRAVGLDYSGFLAIFIGGDWGRKGLAEVIRAVGNTPDVTLAVVGRGDIDHYQKLAREAGAANRVVFAGASNRPQDWLAASDFFVFPSRYEAFSLVTIEAAACGLPMVVTKINGSEELVEDGVNGIFVQPDAGDIALAIARLRDDARRRQQMADAAHRSSLRYNWDAVAEAQATVYEEAAPLFDRGDRGRPISNAPEVSRRGAKL